MLQDPAITKAGILDFCKAIKNPQNEQYKFIHQQHHSLRDKAYVWFFPQPVIRPNNKDEAPKFWHTATFQEAVRLLKEAYVHRKDGPLSQERQNDAKEFISYTRGNKPIHSSSTTQRLLKYTEACPARGQS